MSRQYRRQLVRKLRKLISQSKKRKSRQNRTLDFSTLEPKQLLAVAASTLPANLNLVNNGDFSSVDVSGGEFHSPADISGWDSESGRIKVYGTPNAGNVLELDHSTDTIDDVFQDLDTGSGGDYVISFEHRSNGTDFTNSNYAFEVIWDGEVVGTYSPTELWDNAIIRVSSAKETTRLQFRELSAGNARGGVINDVRVAAVEDQGIANFSFENLIDNSNFSVTDADNLQVPFRNVRAWQAAGANTADKLINIIQDDQSQHGSRYLGVDGSATRTDIISQNLTTQSGEQYYLSFDVLGDSSVDSASNEVRVRFGSDWAATIEGGSEWETYGILVTADSDLSRLVFREVGNGDGTGPFIDNVKLQQVIVQTAVDPPTNDLEVDLDTSATGNGATASFFEGSGPTSILSNLVNVSHASGSTLSFATARIENLQDGSSEVLSVDVGSTGLSTEYNATEGRLRIFGTATIAEYESVLATLEYDNTSASPSGDARSISVSVSDNTISDTTDFSVRQFIDLTVNSSNDVPVITPIADQTIDFAESFELQVSATDPDGEDSELTYELTHSLASITNGPSINSDGLITWAAAVIPDGDVDFTVTVTDELGLETTEEFTLSVSGFEPFSGTGQLSDIDPALRNAIYDSAPEMSIDTSLNYEAILDTTAGEIRLELFADQAPVTVNNFVNLAEDGFYDGVTFHRVITDFVAQGGDPLGTGTGGPGYTFVDEFVDELSFTGAGQLAMANSGPETNGSQFFITYSAQPHLTGAHTIFGQISAGTDALNAINVTGAGVDPTVINSIRIETS